MKRIIILLSFMTLLANVSNGQSDLTFYHMGALTPQSSMNNASFFPDAEFFISFPGISGLNIKMDSEISYNQFMVPVEGTDSVKVDIYRALDNLKEGDNVRFKGDVSLFQFGIRSGNKTFSLFANMRYSGGFNYPVNFLNYFAYGNGNFIGEEVDERQIKGGGIAYHEIGLGYTQDLVILEDKTLRIGGRLKYLTGLAHLSSSKDASVSMFTDPATYDLTIQFNDAMIRTAGLNELQGDDPVGYILGFGSNDNRGFAIDLGADLTINDKLHGYLAINDLGFINWKQDVENYALENSEIVLGGFDDVNDVNVTQALEDSIDVWTEHVAGQVEFRTGIGTQTLLGASYQVTQKGNVSGTLSYNRSSYRSSEIGFGVGYTHVLGKALTLSTTVSKDQFRPVKVGGGFAVRVGALQLYGVFDDVLNSARQVGDINSVEARVGLNLLIGRNDKGKRKPKPAKQKENLSPFPPEYDLDHLLDEDEGTGSGF